MNAIERTLRWLARTMTRVFFRRVETTGAWRLPPRPYLLVANHHNALIDPMLIVGALGVWPRFLAKSTLWRNPLLRPVLEGAGVIPVYRKKDGADTSKNSEMFRACHAVLAEGGSIALFPEGISHHAPDLAPLRSGAARIALESERRHGPLGLKIVPVGLVFEDKQSFRSRALVQVGAPIDPAPELAIEDEREAAQRLTQRIEQGIAALVPTYGTWERAALVGRAAELFGRGGHDEGRRDAPGSRPLMEQAELHRQLVDGFDALQRRDPQRTAAAAEAVRRYDDLLRASGLRDDQVASTYPVPRVARFLAYSLAFLLLLMPAAAIGIALSWIPYRLAGIVGRRMGTNPDMTATMKLYPALILFPAFWIAEAAAIGWLLDSPRMLDLGRAAALWAAALTPPVAALTGWIALKFDDRRRALFREARAFVYLKTRRRVAEALVEARRAAREAVLELAEVYRADASGSS